MRLLKYGDGKNAILMLHGRGSSAEDIIGLASSFDAVSFAFTADGNQWYPQRFMVPKRDNEPFLSSNLDNISQIIDKLKQGYEKVFLLGFSQGACLALEYASKNDVDGVIAFSGGLIGSDDELAVEKKCDVFISCSKNDPHIPFERAEKTVELFEKADGTVKKYFYEGSTHMITPREMDMAKDMIND